MKVPTTLRQEIEAVLGEPVVPWIMRRRPGKSWRIITAELINATDVYVSNVSVAAWAADAEAARIAREQGAA